MITLHSVQTFQRCFNIVLVALVCSMFSIIHAGTLLSSGGPCSPLAFETDTGYHHAYSTLCFQSSHLIVFLALLVGDPPSESININIRWLRQQCFREGIPVATFHFSLLPPIPIQRENPSSIVIFSLRTWFCLARSFTPGPCLPLQLSTPLFTPERSVARLLRIFLIPSSSVTTVEVSCVPSSLLLPQPPACFRHVGLRRLTSEVRTFYQHITL